MPVRHRSWWVLSPVWGLEVDYGPFWEPRRPRPFTSVDDILAAAEAVEPLLARLARRSTLLFLALAGWTVLLALVAFVLPWVLPDGEARTASTIALASLLLAGPACWFRWWGWWSAGPEARDIVFALRTLTDAFLGAPTEDAIAAFGLMRDATPIAFASCHRLTVVPEAAKRAVRLKQPQ